MERKFLNRDRSNIYVEGKPRLIIDAYCVQSFDSIEFNPFSFFSSLEPQDQSLLFTHIHFLRLLFSSSSLQRSSHLAMIMREGGGEGGERREEISRLEKVTFISQPCSFLPVFPRNSSR